MDAEKKKALEAAGWRFGDAAHFLEATCESNEGDYYFHFSAALRIFGEIGDFNSITAKLGVAPTYTHRKGDRAGPTSRRYFEHDMWCYDAAVPEDQPLQVHLASLWQVVRPHIDFLKNSKKRLHVDVFCGYRSNCGTAGFEVDHTALAIFTELEVPFSVSVVI